MSAVAEKQQFVPLRHLAEVKESLRDPIKKEVRDILKRRKAGMTSKDWDDFLKGWKVVAVRISKGAALIRNEQKAGRPIDDYLPFYSLLLEVIGFYCMLARFDNRTFYDAHIAEIMTLSQ